MTEWYLKSLDGPFYVPATSSMGARFSRPGGKRRRCLVKGCTNHAHQGHFVGDLCAPCHTMLTTGKRVPSNAWIAEVPKIPVDGDTK